MILHYNVAMCFVSHLLQWSTEVWASSSTAKGIVKAVCPYLCWDNPEWQIVHHLRDILCNDTMILKNIFSSSILAMCIQSGFCVLPPNISVLKRLQQVCWKVNHLSYFQLLIILDKKKINFLKKFLYMHNLENCFAAFDSFCCWTS